MNIPVCSVAPSPSENNDKVSSMAMGPAPSDGALWLVPDASLAGLGLQAAEGPAADGEKQALVFNSTDEEIILDEGFVFGELREPSADENKFIEIMDEAAQVEFEAEIDVNPQLQRSTSMPFPYDEIEQENESKRFQIDGKIQ